MRNRSAGAAANSCAELGRCPATLGRRISPATRKLRHEIRSSETRLDPYLCQPYAAFWTLLLRMQEVHTRIRLVAPFTMARTLCRLIFQRRLVTLWAWLILFPNTGPRPQTSHTLAIRLSSETI